VSRFSSTREFALVEEAGRHGVQMDVLVHDTADHFCSRDCRLSSARRAVTHAPRLDSSLSFGETGLVGERNLPWPTSVSSAGRRPNVSSALVEYRAIANGRSTSLSGQTLAGCEAAAWMMRNTWARNGAVAEQRDSTRRQSRDPVGRDSLPSDPLQPRECTSHVATVLG